MIYFIIIEICNFKFLFFKKLSYIDFSSQDLIFLISNIVLFEFLKNFFLFFISFFLTGFDILLYSKFNFEFLYLNFLTLNNSEV